MSFYKQANAERDETSEKRLSYKHARGIVQRTMMHESTEKQTQGEKAEWQPLSYWELRGYCPDRISRLAEQKVHPVLGTVNRVAVEIDSFEQIRQPTEQRICRAEAEALQRKSAAEASASVEPREDIGLEEAEEPTTKKTKAGKLTAAEKALQTAEKKRIRQEKKTEEKNQYNACASAAKLLPTMKATCERLLKAIADTEHFAEDIEPHVRENVQAAKETLERDIASGTKTLAALSKGKLLEKNDSHPFPCEKEGRAHLKDANNAIRSLHQAAKSNKDKLRQACGEAPKAKRARREQC